MVTTLEHVIMINAWIVINHPQATKPNVGITRNGGLEANDTGKIIMIVLFGTIIMIELIIILYAIIVVIPKGIIIITVIVIIIPIIYVVMIGATMIMKIMQAPADVEEIERTLAGAITR